MDKSIAFYTGRPGFEVEMHNPGFIVSRGDQKAWLSTHDGSAGRAMPDGREPEPGGWNRMVLEFDDLESVVERLTPGGVRFRNEIVDGIGGMRILADDPDGNPIELFQATGAVHV